MYVCMPDTHDYCLGVSSSREGRLGDNGIALWGGCGIAWQQQPPPPLLLPLPLPLPLPPPLSASIMAASEKSKSWRGVSAEGEGLSSENEQQQQLQSSLVRSSSGSTSTSTSTSTSISGSGSSLKRHLSRAITQPRGLYEALIDTYGPVTAPDDSLGVVEVALVEEAYQSLQVSDYSDAGTCSSHEDDGTAQDDRNAGAGAAGAQGSVGGRSKARGGKNRPPRLSDEEWAKSILARKTGYGCTQRNQVLKYISQLEARVDELQTVVSDLSPKVELLDQHRWILKGENSTLKQKVARLSQMEQKQDETTPIARNDGECTDRSKASIDALDLGLEFWNDYEEDENLVLQEEMQLLKIRDRQRPQENDAAEATNSSIENSGSNFSTEATPTASIYPTVSSTNNNPLELEESSNYRESSSDRDNCKSAKRPSPPLCANEHLRTHSNASNSNVSSISSSTTTSGHGLTQRREDQKTTNPSLVKWPSTLYRSVSSIRKDMLELAIQDRS